MNLLKIGFPAVVLLFSNGFANIALYNVILQLTVFIVTANIPALITGRMSYVDLGWPYGLVTIGILPFTGSNVWENDLRAKLVMLAYLVAGGRMAFGGTMMFFK